MKAVLSLVCAMVLFALTAAKVFDEVADALEMNQEGVVETPPPWVTENTDYTKVGCYKDKKASRALPVLVENYRLRKIDWSDMSKIVKKCADAVKAKGWKVFAVQFYGECWSGPEAEYTFHKHGTSENCWPKVGKHWTNMVYKFKEGPTGPGGNVAN